MVLDQDEIVAIDGPDFELLLYKVKDEYLKFEHKIYQPGFHHLAIKVSGRDVVEASYEAVASIGATVLEGPKEFKNYPGNYFAFLFLIPMV
ncbi:VOC family protein [Chromobacterium vaccinii]|uniref:hypothetical protein n=1 Tax=Chromobacterium vaccinii TaxID=1108595 RepID=UPI0011C03ECA|nr:hypothetical protein [Chromobacterium vaccinii]